MYCEPGSYERSCPSSLVEIAVRPTVALCNARATCSNARRNFLERSRQRIGTTVWRSTRIHRWIIKLFVACTIYLRERRPKIPTTNTKLKRVKKKKKYKYCIFRTWFFFRHTCKKIWFSMKYGWMPWDPLKLCGLFGSKRLYHCVITKMWRRSYMISRTAIIIDKLLDTQYTILYSY